MIKMSSQGTNTLLQSGDYQNGSLADADDNPLPFSCGKSLFCLLNSFCYDQPLVCAD
jgi:hypothetical protein